MSKRIMIFADGTGNTVDGFDSNVLRLCKMLEFSVEANQVAIYDPGVGTMASVEALHTALPPPVQIIDDECMRPTLLRRMELPFGLLFGAGTERNIRRLYRKLICMYEPNDEIFSLASVAGHSPCGPSPVSSIDVECHGASASVRPTEPSCSRRSTSKPAGA